MQSVIKVESKKDGHLSNNQWLSQKADNIRRALALSTQLVVFAGQELIEAKKAVPRGQWSTWVAQETGINLRTAQRWMAMARKLGQYIDIDVDLAILAGQKSAFYMLMEKDTTDEVREIALSKMQAGEYLTTAIVDGIANSVEKAVDTIELLEHSTERVTRLVLEHDVAPEIIPMLSRIEQQIPEAFDEMELSGCIHDAEGDPIELINVNKRDLKDYYEHTRFESRKQLEMSKPYSEKWVLSKLRDLADRWPKKLWLYAADSKLYVMRCGSHGEHVHDKEFVVDEIHMRSDW